MYTESRQFEAKGAASWRASQNGLTANSRPVLREPDYALERRAPPTQPDSGPGGKDYKHNNVPSFALQFVVVFLHVGPSDIPTFQRP